jgi:hypothetical protein
VRIAYRHRTPYIGVRGRVLRVGLDDVVILSDKSGAEVRVLFGNIAEVEALAEPPVDRVAANQEGAGWMASIATPSRQEAPPRGQIDESVGTPAAAESHAVVPALGPLVGAPLSPAVVEPATVVAPSWQPTTAPPPIETSGSERSVFHTPVEKESAERATQPGDGIEQATEVHRPPSLWRAIGELAIGVGVLAYLWLYVGSALGHLDACEFNGLIWECVYQSGGFEITNTIYVPVAIVAGLGGLLAVTRGVIGTGRAVGAVPSGVRSWRASEPGTRRISLLSAGALVLSIIPYTAPFGILVALVTLRQISRASTDVGTPHGGSFERQRRRARIALWVGLTWVILLGGSILAILVR